MRPCQVRMNNRALIISEAENYLFSKKGYVFLMESWCRSYRPVAAEVRKSDCGMRTFAFRARISTLGFYYVSERTWYLPDCYC